MEPIWRSAANSGFHGKTDFVQTLVSVIPCKFNLSLFLLFSFDTFTQLLKFRWIPTELDSAAITTQGPKASGSHAP